MSEDNKTYYYTSDAPIREVEPFHTESDLIHHAIAYIETGGSGGKAAELATEYVYPEPIDKTDPLDIVLYADGDECEAFYVRLSIRSIIRTEVERLDDFVAGMHSPGDRQANGQRVSIGGAHDPDYAKFTAHMKAVIARLRDIADDAESKVDNHIQSLRDRGYDAVDRADIDSALNN